MANIFKSHGVGDTRINPNTYDIDVWDGTDWVSGHSVITSNYRTTSMNAATASTSTRYPVDTLSIYEFLKNNLRVAEYLDDNGKIHTVRLELRQGEAYVWEPIRRIKINDSTPRNF
jgi:hypothetical protein